MRLRRVATVLVLLAVVTAPLAGAATVVGPQSAAVQTQQQADGPEPADEVFVRDNGDVVLVYEGDAEEDETDTEGSFDGGLGGSEGLAFGVLDLEEGVDDGSFDFAATLTRNALSGSTSFDVARPDALETLDVTLDQVRDADTAETSLSVAVEGSPEEPTTNLVSSAGLEGTVTTSPDTLSLEASASAETFAVTSSSLQSFSVTETDTGFEVSASQEYAVGDRQARQYATRESARQTLRSQFGFAALQLGGSASVTIDSYSFDESTNRLDIEYTVTLEGVKEGLREQLTQSLTEAEDLELGQEEASAIADQLLSVELRTVEAEVVQEPGSATADVALEVGNYDQLQLALLELSAAGGEGVDQSVVDQRRQTLEAAQTADLSRTTEFSLEYAADDTVSVQASVDSAASNWAAYTDELESLGRDVGSTSLQFTASTEGDRVTGEGSFELQREGLYQTALDGLLETLRTGEDVESGTIEAVETFDRTGLQQAKLEASATTDGATVTGGAEFNDSAALREAVSQVYDGLSVTDVVVRTEGDTTRTYVFAEGAVESGADESAVRSLSVVGEDTTVNMPGDYDRSFPEFDSEQARSFLGVPPAEDGDGGGGGLAQPGMGVAVAVVALLAAVVFLRRRD